MEDYKHILYAIGIIICTALILTPFVLIMVK